MYVVCCNCKNSFEIFPQDEEFYKKMDVPHPSFCPKCRLQRRLAFRNERKLFRRKCDKSGKFVISNIRPDAEVPVYSVEEWFKDSWTAPMLPRFDFTRGGFEQFKELSRVSPRMHKATAGNEVNSEYMNHAGNSKNCYYTFNSEYNEDCMYLRFADHCRDCMDSNNIMNSELCYECVNVENCYHVLFSDDCKQCRDSAFLRYCRGVSNCLFCYGLLDKQQFHIFNEPRSKEEFIQELKNMRLDTYSGVQDAIRRWNEFSSAFPRMRKIILNCENCTGDAVYNSKNAQDCYNANRLHDCRYVLNSVDVKDTYDMYAYGETELGYEVVTMMNCYNVKFCLYIPNSDNMEYCDTCWSCHFCFGCIGLQNKSYCIFNKQYTREEYEELVPRIKEKMRACGEYGEFFPTDFSFFPYEDTLAQDYFPREIAPPKLREGEFKETSALPDAISSADFSKILNSAYRCPITKTPFRFQKQELDFYKKMRLPLPRECFEARYARRNELIPFPY